MTPRAFPFQIPARCHCQTCRAARRRGLIQKAIGLAVCAALLCAAVRAFVVGLGGG